MAERRMFSKTIIDSDAFLDLPQKVQLLYFHLGLRADDDGFVNKPRSILRMAGCAQEDLERLVQEKFLIQFDSGVVVIRHWNVHNRIRKDSYKETIHEDEKNMLSEDKNRIYCLAVTDPSQGCDRPVTAALRQDRIDQDRIGQFSSGQESIGGCSDSEAEASFRPPSVTEVMIYVKQKKYFVDPERFVEHYTENGWREGRNKIRDWKEMVDLWQQRRW